MKYDWALLFVFVIIFLLGIILDNVGLFGIGFAGQCLFYLFEMIKDDREEIGEESDSDCE
jgi:hypothetical protein